MPEQSSKQTLSPEITQGIIPLESLTPEDLVAGTEIVGFNNEEDFDQFEKVTVEALQPHLEENYPLYGRGIIQNEPLSKLLIRTLPKGFFGKRTNFRLIVTPPNLDIVPNHDTLSDTPDNVLSFIVARDLISTGRGNIGTVNTQISYYPRMKSFGTRSKNPDTESPKPYLHRASKLVTPESVTAMLDASKTTSTIIKRHALFQGLLRGGLPGLGKRR